jgi:hypothetical protein
MNPSICGQMAKVASTGTRCALPTPQTAESSCAPCKQVFLTVARLPVYYHEVCISESSRLPFWGVLRQR